jgi:hypothetical protein
LGFVDKVTVGLVSCEYFGFPCQFSFHQLIFIDHPITDTIETDTDTDTDTDVKQQTSTYMETKLLTDPISHSDNILISISIYLVLYTNKDTVIDNLEVMYIANPFGLLTHSTLLTFPVPSPP